MKCLLELSLAGGLQDSTAADIRRSPATETAIRHQFAPDDDAFLEEVQRACFLYFWREVGTPAALAKDRKKAPVSSVASVGFQLSSLPIGIEHGWITRAEGQERATTVLKALIERSDNRRFGLYYHYLDYDTGGQSDAGYEVLASTVDSALLLAGAITAGQYFQGDIKLLADRMVADADWRAFATGPGDRVSLGWKPADTAQPTGKGEFLPMHWSLAGDEERLVYFLGIGSPDPAHALDPSTYYRLERPVKRHKDMPPYVVTWQGTLFNYFFSHCWIDYRSLGLDDPSRLGVDAIRVDWFENSRRAVLTHRQRCIENSHRFKSLAEDRWGLSACGARDGYIVPEIQPNYIDKDQWYEGTVAPYAAGSAVMFAPVESLAALRAFRKLEDGSGRPVAWRDPGEGGYGFVDSFNLDQQYASDDYVGIDQGPMLLAIENARTGLIWRLFMASPTARRACDRLGLSPSTSHNASPKPAAREAD
ncbi:MAG TPA: glucoamylase family protein [Phycisphaerae bacterium]|nr:glucoamylase family protein [Phycisphaerae bacterium]